MSEVSPSPGTARRAWRRAAAVVAVAAAPLAAALLPASDCLARERPPNVVIVLTDDQGWGDLSFKGNTNLRTPRIDALAAGGAVFDWFYVQPLCAPTRAELLTGRFFGRTGVHGVTRRTEWMDLDEVTIGDVFKGAGYATGCFGKWHNGSAYPYHPNGRGFDEFYGFCCGHWSHYFDPTLEHNGEVMKAEGFIIDVLTERAIDFMRSNRERPFLCYVPYNTPHSPFQVPDRWYDRFREADIAKRHRDPGKEKLDVTRCALAMCENIDWNVGRLVDSVEKLGLAGDTVFVYFSDNGPNSWRWNGGMRGKKGSVDEGGVRSPCVVSWPGRIRAGSRVAEIAGAIDLMPTLADLAGLKLPETKPLDGVSLAPLLTGQAGARRERALYAASPTLGSISIRTPRYRAGKSGLFDVATDPGQRRDLSKEMPDLHAKLMARIAAWRADVSPRGGRGERVISVGHRAFPVTHLHAQDGVPSGKIRWSSRHPNASFFTRWTDAKDGVRWPVDVTLAGEYEVTMLYTCAEADVGAEVEIAFGDESVRARIDKPFDPPLKTGEDRVKRSESYEKDFESLALGRLRLSKGRGEVRLRALGKPGESVCDVRTLTLRLVAAD